MEENVKLTKLAKCAGCGAKLGANELKQIIKDLKVHNDENLLVGFDKSDDAAVFKINDETACAMTVDFFPPIDDDPYIYGQIAAANALSDIYAMGGEPKYALNLLCVPENMPRDTVHQILRGGYDKVYEAGAVISGGHTIYDEQPKYGLSVTGFVNPLRILTNSSAKPSDVLILTKPLGIGILTTAAKASMLSDDGRSLARRLMTTLNKSARDAMLKYEVHSCTDVTGFGLLGHLLEMTQGSDVNAILDIDKIDLIDEAYEFAKIGLLPEGMYRNRKFCEKHVNFKNIELAKQDMLFDPQTSGGLLISVAEKDAESLYNDLKECVPSAQIIGHITKHQNEKRITVK